MWAMPGMGLVARRQGSCQGLTVALARNFSTSWPASTTAVAALLGGLPVDRPIRARKGLGRRGRVMGEARARRELKSRRESRSGPAPGCLA
jgi:hypothetical protein